MARPDETETQSGEPEPVDAEFEAVDESEEAAPAKPARRGPGWLLFILTLLVTALIAAAVAWALTRYVAPRLEGAPGETQALEQRLTAIEARLPEDGLGDRVATLETRVSELSGLPDRVEELARSVVELEDTVAALETAPATGPGERPAMPDTLAERLSELETQAGQALQLARSLQEALTDQEGGGADVSAALDRLRSDIESLRGRLTERAAALSAEDEALAGAVASVAETVGELQVRLGTIADEAGQALQLARTAQAGTGSETAHLRELSARALGLAALSEAASGSGPFEAERAALARVWPGQSDLAALESMARSGAPAHAALAESFPGEAIRDAAGGSRTWWGLIEVRPAEDAEGEGPSAIAARAERQLERGNLAGAVSAIEELDGEPAEAVAGWLRGARARLEIERRIASLRSALSEAAAQGSDQP